jgi:hypothetical protein
MRDIMIKPTRVEASGDRVLAMTSPMPVAKMIPITMAMKAMKGRMLVMI